MDRRRPGSAPPEACWRVPRFLPASGLLVLVVSCSCSLMLAVDDENTTGTAAQGGANANDSGSSRSDGGDGLLCDEICDGAGVSCEVAPLERAECRRQCEAFVASSPGYCTEYRGPVLDCLKRAIESCGAVEQCGDDVDRIWFCTNECMTNGWAFGSFETRVDGYLSVFCACAPEGATAGTPCARPRDCAPHCCCPDTERLSVRMCIDGQCVDRERACSEVTGCY